MDPSPKLTLIVPVYKTEPYLRRCVDSILRQTLTDFELILVDDGSPDRCPAICDDYGKADTRVRVVHQENGGLGFVRKVGVSLARGEYLGFVDSDDWIQPEMYDTLCRTATDNACDVVICDWTCHYAATHTAAAFTESHTLKPNHLYERSEIETRLLAKVLLEELHGYSWNRLYRRDLLTQCNLDKGVGLTNMQDWVLNCEYFKKTRRLMYINQRLYHYAIHSGNALQGCHKDYLALILKLHEFRLAYLREYNMDRMPEMIRACMHRFMDMAIFGAFQYEFLFTHTSLQEKLQRISAVVNHAEVRRALAADHASAAGLGMLGKAQRCLFRVRSPLLIYGFAESVDLARRVKRKLRERLARHHPMEQPAPRVESPCL